MELIMTMFYVIGSMLLTLIGFAIGIAIIGCIIIIYLFWKEGKNDVD